jgi:hypothetical protein
VLLFGCVHVFQTAVCITAWRIWDGIWHTHFDSCPILLAVDLAAAREQYATLKAQAAALAEKKSQVEAAQAAAEANVTQLQVGFRPLKGPSSALMYTFPPQTNGRTRTRDNKSAWLCCGFDVQEELGTVRSEREADATEYERRLQASGCCNARPPPEAARLSSACSRALLQGSYMCGLVALKMYCQLLVDALTLGQVNNAISLEFLSVSGLALQEAVDSAEQWKTFAEGQQARAAALEEQCAAVQAELQV